MSKALYRKYRSKSLDDIVGQDHVTQVLKRAIETDTFAHAYLLTGPRGVGKTSIARILAHEINQLPYNEEAPHLDIIEIDAASNNGVEDVRELRERVQIAPTSARRKIYIVDEVHMLSKAAFNALLKTLEEPPAHVVFILATTDVDKIPATIISRTQRFGLKAARPADTAALLRTIANQENIHIDDDALELIARRGDGSFRDSLSLLDQMASVAKDASVTRLDVERLLGLATNEEVKKVLQAYDAKDLARIVNLLDEVEASGIQASVLTNQLIQLVRAELIEAPSRVGLLDELLEVAKSSHPFVKLLTVLAAHAYNKPKTAALASPAPVISATIEELNALDQKAVSKKPSGKTPDEPPPEQKGTPVAPTGELDWQKVLDYTKQHFVAIYSVLAKCSHELQDTTLIIYTNSAFYKKKLDDTKYRINITKSLIETGAGGWTIETISTPPPPKDGLAASVAAIMGGGEEVAVSEAA